MTGRPTWVGHRARTTVLAVVVALALTAELIWAAPYIGRGLSTARDANLLWVLLAVVAETSSMMCFARMQRLMLHAGGADVPLRHAAATVFAGNAMSVTLPGGSVVSAAYTSRRFWSKGASAPLVGFAFTATGALSTAALAVLAGVGGTLSGDPFSIAVAAAEIGAAVSLLVTFVLLMRRPDRVRRIVGRGLRLLRRDTAPAERIATELSTIRPGLRVWARAFVFAMINWAADLCCLLAAAHAVGLSPSLQMTILAYTAAMAASSSIPLLPGGLGVVETSAVLVLAHGGVDVAAATAAVVVWRLISLGAVAVIGWGVVLMQRAHRAEAVADATSANSGGVRVPRNGEHAHHDPRSAGRARFDLRRRGRHQPRGQAHAAVPAARPDVVVVGEPRPPAWVADGAAAGAAR